MYFLLAHLFTGCLDKDKCREDGGNWTNPSNCVTYGCRINNQNGLFNPQIKIVDVGNEIYVKKEFISEILDVQALDSYPAHVTREIFCP